MEALALILAAGRGERLGRGPKALVEVAGRSLLDWSADALGRARGVAWLQPVLPADQLNAPLEAPSTAQLLPPVAGGATRQASVATGLEAARERSEWVLVHDAARCLVEPADVDAVLSAAGPTGAALLVAPVTDTIKVVAGGRVVRTPPRDELAAALTPQAFRVEILAEALDKARRDGFAGTDCASLVERLGVDVRACPGSPENWKVTHADDLARAEAILARRGAGR